MEAKAGIVYSRVAQVSKGRRLLVDKRTYAGVEDIEAYGEKLALLAGQRGAFKARRLWFVSDGAESLRRLRREHFPTATYFLDLWHLEHRIFEALGGAGSAGSGSPAARLWRVTARWTRSSARSPMTGQRRRTTISGAAWWAI